MAPTILEKAVHSDIPDDVIRCDILLGFTCKFATHFKVISKKYHRIFTNNAMLRARQARLCPPCPALIHMDLPNRHLGAYTSKIEAIDVLSSIPDIVGIPSGFEFLGCFLENGILKLLASTNGFVCILYTPINATSHLYVPILFVANSAMQKAQSIPGSAKHIARFDTGIGLAFDQGIVEIVLWFDIATTIAGVMKMPWIQLVIKVKGPIHHDIDTSIDGTLVCTTLDKDGLTVYHLVGEWKTKDRILLYNMVISKTYDTGKELANQYSKNPFYVYRNSMANIPHIAVPIQGEICEGNTGGCICAMYAREG
uniref:Uncharacterized protein n=1 Tax=Oryza punctata TaxID=4537 RepID=A0A0E0MLA6_ORYPU